MTDRRIFLKQLGILGAALSAGNLLSACSPKLTGMSSSTSPLGLQLYTLRDIIGKDVKGVLSKVAQAGYQTVEPYGFSSKDGFWGMKPAEFLKVLNDLGLKAPSGHYFIVDYFLNGNTSELKASIDAAAAIQTEYFTVPYLTQEMVTSIDAYKRIAEKINKLAEMAKAAGMKTAYHNHNFEFEDKNGQKGYDILLNETDKDLVKFEMDIYWVVRAGYDPIKLFSENPGRFAMWHVKDMDKNKAEWNTEVGKGKIDFKPIFAKAKESGMKYFFVEQETNYQPDPIGAIASSAKFIKSNLM